MPETVPGLALGGESFQLGPSSVSYSQIRSLHLRESVYFRRNSLFGMVPVRVYRLEYTTHGSDLSEWVLDEGNLPPGIRFSKEDFDGFHDQYGALLEKTFAHRILPYFQELEARGWFTIEGIDFYPRVKIVAGRRVIPAGDIEIRHLDRNIWIRNRVPSMFRHFNFRLPIGRDPDVWLALMKVFQEGR